MVINPIVGVNIPIIRIPIKGGMTIPNTMSLDPGTYIEMFAAYVANPCGIRSTVLRFLMITISGSVLGHMTPRKNYHWLLSPRTLNYTSNAW